MTYTFRDTCSAGGVLRAPLKLPRCTRGKVLILFPRYEKLSRNSSGVCPCPRCGIRGRPARTTGGETSGHDDGNIFTCTVALYGLRFVSSRVIWCSHASPLIFTNARNTPPMQQKIPWVQNKKPRLQKIACAHGTPGAGCDRGEDASRSEIPGSCKSLHNRNPGIEGSGRCRGTRQHG